MKKRCCNFEKLESYKCLKGKKKQEKKHSHGHKTPAAFYGTEGCNLVPGRFRIPLVLCSLLWTVRTQLSWAKQITAAPILPSYFHRSNPLNKWLHNLLAGWLTDTQFPPRAPGSALSARALHIILPPPLMPSLSIAHFLVFFFFFFLPHALCHGPILSFHFGINPFHPSGLFSSFSALSFFCASSFSVWLLHSSPMCHHSAW